MGHQGRGGDRPGRDRPGRGQDRRSTEVRLDRPDGRGKPDKAEKPQKPEKARAREERPPRRRADRPADRGGDREAAAPPAAQPKQAAAPKQRPAKDGPAPKAAIAVGETENKPELVETLPIVSTPGTGRRVVLSLGPETKGDSPLPDLAAGDRLLAFAELELTTDAEDPNHPGRIGNAYSYAPNVEATLLLAPGPATVAAGEGGAIELPASPWQRAVTHQQHHAVITFGDLEARIGDGGLTHLNLVVEASHPQASDGDLILVGQNETTPTVVQDMAGIRAVRFRPGNAAEPPRERQASCLCAGVPVAKRETVVLSYEVADLQQGDQLLVRGRLTTDAAGLAAPARISTRMFIADAPDQTEPGGAGAASVTWKGHLSKFTGFNCIPGDGPQTSSKYGVATVRQAPGRSLYVNMVAVSGAPFGGLAEADELRIEPAGSGLEITRFAAAG